ncbi:MAG: hypothetical protein A2Y82_04615 [Candidatus Buchananbacteria bacterium RBG_13_36_9]|uniref:Uncharacterized protein n=1 Tax=Candidatus Buchananbacteria bacterium RBG_13_36_9 TaxID=1797530 RepID=A0A1G1XQN8_9BACT|nr:MAG: hypothetical protein A2Y82_04615 [Candidatus Buchananbacteria bacterium RBG_13_36_9]
MRYYKIIILSLFIIGQFFINYTVKVARAFEFDPNQIIADNELNDYDCLDLNAIQEFLNNKNGILKNFRAIDNFGVERTAAEIIFNASQTYKVSPKWILATLQKEQSLITNPLPTQKNIDWAMGYAVCDSCSTDDPALAMFKGFGVQVDRATRRIKYYSDNPSEFNFKVGNLYSVDGRDVLIYNQATANLFNYTPHIHGNFNFWNIWYRWFAKIYPDGTLLKQMGQAGIWLIENGQRRPFWSKTALVSRYDESKIIEVTKNDLERYETGYPIKYANYSLLKSPDGKIYLIVNNEKKEIESADVFKTIGFNPEEVIDVSDEELVNYEEGRKITLNSIYPQGALLQNKANGGVYYVEDGIKYPILAKEVLTNNFQNYKLTVVSQDELDKYVTAATGMKLKDGTLIKVASDSKVYVISNGERRWVANESTFNQLGYEWTNIVTVSEKIANLHPLGENLDALLPAETQIAIENN